MVAVNLWYHVGPANEEPGRTGFAHLFEHMMFQGSKHVPRRLALPAARGRRRAATSTARPTSTAPTTSRRVPSNQLELALWLESDRMGYLLDKVDQAALVEPAGRRPQRAAAERREPAVRHRRRSARPAALPEGPSLLRQRHRLARGHPGGEARRREELLQAVLRAEQRQPGDRRRLRHGADEGAGREVLRHAEARPGGAADHGRDAEDHRRAPPGRARIASSCRASTWRG